MQTGDENCLSRNEARSVSSALYGMRFRKVANDITNGQGTACTNVQSDEGFYPTPNPYPVNGEGLKDRFSPLPCVWDKVLGDGVKTSGRHGLGGLRDGATGRAFGWIKPGLLDGRFGGHRAEFVVGRDQVGAVAEDFRRLTLQVPALEFALTDRDILHDLKCRAAMQRVLGLLETALQKAFHAQLIPAVRPIRGTLGHILTI